MVRSDRSVAQVHPEDEVAAEVPFLEPDGPTCLFDGPGKPLGPRLVAARVADEEIALAVRGVGHAAAAGHVGDRSSPAAPYHTISVSAARYYRLSSSSSALASLEIGRVKALGEPAVDRREESAGFGALALVAPEPGEAGGDA